MQALLLTRKAQDARAGLLLEYWAASSRGPILVRLTGQRPLFFVERHVVTRAGERRPVALASLGGRPVDGVYFRGQRELTLERDRLIAAGDSPLEADVGPADRFLMERFITGSFSVEGGREIARPGYLEIVNPRLRRAEHAQPLRVAAIDIETDGLDGALFSIALSCEPTERVWMVGRGAAPDGVTLLPDERSLLEAFSADLRALDPDVVIGWNVVDFDLAFLLRRARALGLPLRLGRDGSALEIVAGRAQPMVRMAGRVVLDGIAALRSASHSFESYSLDDVARRLLGRGKLDVGDGDRVASIRRLHAEDPAALARYNLEDCRLTRDIFARADLLGFLVERQQLTGLALDRHRGAVAAFDNLYLPRLHREGFVAPTVAKNSGDEETSPGGHVMEAAPGLYDNVLALDFKSLYPSIIRTFCIDPLGLAVAGEGAVPGFDGARFDRERHILPEMIATLWAARDEAKRRGDLSRSYAIKILMNSFYGVLGASTCRFFSPRLVSSITRRGHEIILRSRERIEAAGHRVIYGDTDSLFVWLGGDLDGERCRAVGAALVASLNEAWRRELAEGLGLDSRLEIQLDAHYLRFFLPTMRHSARGSKKRYAGLRRAPDGSATLVFKGLEAVRSDWTPLARRFQTELYRRIFVGEPFAPYVTQVSAELLGGKLDDELVYRKRLRRELDDYVHAPPHVQAARQLEERARFVEYWMTLRGPEAVGHRSTGLDYRHYLEKQLAPAADAILQHCGTDFMRIAGAQLDLF